MGEFEFIRFLEGENSSFFHKEVIRGIGDDCAVIEKDKDSVILISTELFIEDIHFLREKTSPYKLGIKAVNASLSDIAAMGGVPLYLLSSVSVPKDIGMGYLEVLYKGIKYACSRYKVDIIGGDTSSSINRIAISITVIGKMEKRKVVYRKGARPGDLIYVTGYLGDSAAGLFLLKEEIDAPLDVKKKLIDSHNIPEPDILAGRIASEYEFASAMIDISDGLVADLNHICEQSNVGAILNLEDIPFSKELFSLKDRLSIYELALYGGEDYKLIIIVRPEKRRDFEEIFKKRGILCFKIGEIKKEKGIKISSKEGIKELEIRGYEHF